MDIATAAATATHRWSASPRRTGVELHRVPWRVWPERRDMDGRFEMPALGAFGEMVAIEWLRANGEPDAQRCGGSELPIDVLTSRYAVEVKAGLATNGRQAQQWRLTFSDAKGAERRAIAAMEPFEKRRYLAEKQDRCLSRKLDLLAQVNAQTGRLRKPVTITLIVDPQRRDADVFWFNGWHQRIGWNTPETREAYRGTYHVKRT